MADNTFLEFRAKRSEGKALEYIRIGMITYLIGTLLSLGVGMAIGFLTPYALLAAIFACGALVIGAALGIVITLAKAGFDWLSDYIAYKSSDSQDQVSDKTIGNTYTNTITPSLTEQSQSQNTHKNQNEHPKTLSERFNNFIMGSFIGSFFRRLAGASPEQIQKLEKKNKNQANEVIYHNL